MCGRYSLVSSQNAIETHFKINYENEPYVPYYNAYPSQKLPVISSLHPDKISLYHWGLIPYWSKTSEIAQSTFNARAESIHRHASFKVPFERRRCLIPANGYVEWRNFGGIKTPFFHYCTDQPLFAFAGLWDTWMNQENEEILRSFTIITTKANKRLKVINNRMPVILKEPNYEKWLNPGTDLKRITGLLRPYAEKHSNAYRISMAVNNPVHQYPELLNVEQEPLYKDNLDVKRFFA